MKSKKGDQKKLAINKETLKNIRVRTTVNRPPVTTWNHNKVVR